jgi:hypothetical protein
MRNSPWSSFFLRHALKLVGRLRSTRWRAIHGRRGGGLANGSVQGRDLLEIEQVFKRVGMFIAFSQELMFTVPSAQEALLNES